MMASLTIGMALAQDKQEKPQEPAQKGKAKPGDDAGKGKANPKQKPNAKRKVGGVLAAGGVGPAKGKRPNAADPLGKRDAGAIPEWPFHVKVRLGVDENTALAASYYPPKGRLNAPVVLMIHETGNARSGKDFETPIAELKNQSLAEYLQEIGYAILVLDQRGHGANPRRELTARQWQATIIDLQAAYRFLIDRQNRGEFDLTKFGVVALGDGANLVAAWAATPGAAVSSPGRVGDLSALVLVDPVGEVRGLQLAPAITALASRVPILLIAGEKHAPSFDAVKALRPTVERQRQSKVTTFDTNLHGFRLVQLYPKVATAIVKFLEDPVRFKVSEWEPRYLLEPVPYEDEGAVSKEQEDAANPREPANPPANNANAAEKKGGAAKKPAAGKAGRAAKKQAD